MINKKIYIPALATALVFSSVFALTVFAEQERNQDKLQMRDAKSMMPMKTSAIGPLENMLKRLEQVNIKDFSFSTQQLEHKDVPATMTINPKGEVRITNGRVTAVSGDTVTVEIWKMNFSVHNMPDAKVLGGNKHQFTFAQIAVGDMLNVLGQLDATTAAFIHAQVIHDRTQINQSNTDERSRLQMLIDELIKRLNNLRGGQTSTPTSSPSPSPSSSPSPSTSLSPSPSPLPSSSASPSPSPSTSPTN